MIEILLATYNGEKFLSTQINSILSQTYQNWTLLVHDDGSTDKTVEIIKDYEKFDNRIKLIEDNYKFGNAGENFMHLVKYSNAEYIMFCDQDDLWHSSKIEKMLNLISNENQSSPLVGYSGATVWDGKKELYFQANNPSTLQNTLFSNCGIQGASAIFNHEMLQLMKRWKGKISMHDHLLLLLALSCGKALYSSEPLMLYRKHEDAVTIKSRRQNNFRNFFSGFRDYVLDENHFTTIHKFYQIYFDQININDKNIICTFLSLPHKNWARRTYDIIKNKFTIRGSSLIILLKLLSRPFCVNDLRKIN